MEKGMEKRLYSAAVNGDVDCLHKLLQEDALILDRVTLTCFNETPLHIAVMKGHKAFAIELLKYNSQLAMEVDSRKSSPLHMAAAKGFLEIVEALLEVKPDVCVARDRDGRNPLHLAAMKGKVEVLKVLYRKRPRAACERTNRGETILHLCVKYDQIEALKMLVDGINDHQFVSAKDDDGNTILHLAVRDKQMETIKYLLNSTRMDLKEKNAKGDTALDILSQTTQRDVMDLEISDTLREAGALRAKELPHSSSNKNSTSSNNSPSHKIGHSKEQHHTAGDWLAKKRDSIMVVASLIATMAFQAGINPTGGVWQDDHLEKPNPHKAGESVMAYHNPNSYRYFIRANTVAFVSSLSTILLLISGLPFRRRIFMWILMVIMWLTITTIALTYAISIVVLTPENQKGQLSKVIQIAVTVWCGVMSLLLLGNTLRLIGRWLKKTKGIEIWPWRRFRNSIGVDDHGNGGQETLQMIHIAHNND